MRCGSGEGLGGWNCRHSFHAFVEGVSERTYTDDELNAMKAENRTFQYEGKEYDGYTATQKQRQIERTLRKLKRERSSYKAAGLTDEYNAVNAKIRRLTYKYRQFSKKAGLPEQRERTKVQYIDDKTLDRVNEQADVIKQVKLDIRNGEYSLVLNSEKQARHMGDTIIQGRSVITISASELQEIINNVAGTGEIQLTRKNAWKSQEIVDAGREIGYTVNEEGKLVRTSKLKIHYSNTGTHAVPYSGKEKT